MFSVNGVGTVDVAKLTAITTFNDESFNSKDEGDKSDVTRLTKWFWEVVESLSQNERQELLYFWTGEIFLRHRNLTLLLLHFLSLTLKFEA